MQPFKFFMNPQGDIVALTSRSLNRQKAYGVRSNGALDP